LCRRPYDLQSEKRNRRIHSAYVSGKRETRQYHNSTSSAVCEMKQKAGYDVKFKQTHLKFRSQLWLDQEYLPGEICNGNLVSSARVHYERLRTSVKHRAGAKHLTVTYRRRLVRTSGGNSATLRRRFPLSCTMTPGGLALGAPAPPPLAPADALPCPLP
jgi:hypothetical protein